MKKILFINIFAFLLGSLGLSAQCNSAEVTIHDVTTETCVGSSDASAIATGVGVNGVTYLWSNGQTTPQATGLTSTTYTVTVTDGAGCTASESVTIELDPEGVWIMNTSTPVSCNGGSDGTAYAGVMTGVPPYTYQWDDPAGTTTSSPVGLAAGVYHVTVTDSNGCSNVAPVTVEEPTTIVVISNSANEICFGDSNGSASVTTSGGTGQKTYTWSNGGNSSSINNLTAGTYTVTATDENGCTSVASINVSLTNPQINISGSSTSIACFGGNDGTATVNVASGNGPFSYSWSNGATSATANGLTAGNYTVTVTGADGCTATTTVTVSQPAQLTITTNNPNTTNIICHGDNNGAIMVTTSGGTGTITYLWNTGATTQMISNLSAGTYSVTATDANGCTVTTTHTITEPAVLTATGSGTDVTTVGGTNGTATVTPVGGTGPYTYLWSNGATTQTISNLSAGTYTVTVTDANGCTTTTTIVITEPIATIVLTVNSTPSLCGANDGTATVMASGGFSPYTYLWSDGQTTSTATGLSGGTYTVTVTDNVGNTATTSVTVIETSGVTATASSSNETCTGSSDGHVSVSTSGGVGQMTFAWSNGATTSTVNGLSVGTYTVTVTDENGCTATASATIELSPEGIWVDITTTHVTCFGGNDGAAASVVTTGVAPYTYAWSNGATTQNISDLTAGTYTVTVTDVNGCEGVFTTEVTQPTQLTGTISSTNIDCGANNGSASVTVNGGTPGYTYLWSNGSTGSSISGVSAGTYTVTATDSNGCTVVSSTMIMDNNTLAVSSATTSDPTTAGGNDGSINIEVSGGTAPYTYLWSNGATTQDISGLTEGCYTVTITDAIGCSITSTHCINDPGMLNVTVTTVNNGCMGNNMGTATATANDGTPPYTYMWSTVTGFPLGTTQTITGLTNGTYLVTVTDANGVQGTGTGVVTGSGGVGSSATVINLSCNGANDGSATANGIGGAPGLDGYQYNWSNGETTQSISNLAPGDYTVTVTDLEGCTSTSMVTVVEPSTVTVSSAIGTNPTTAGGSDGSINITVMGGTPGYTFLWSNGATTEDISGLTAGCYTVTITDSNGCTATNETCITDPSVSCVVVVTSTPESCVPGTDGTVTATPGPGCPSPFTFSWEDGNGNPIGSTGTVTGLGTGFYTVTVTNGNGSTVTETVQVTGGNTVMSSTTVVNVSCNGGNDGSATVTGSGGSGNYTYMWSNGATTQNISNLTAGTYTVTVTDDNGCTSVSSVIVTESTVISTAGTVGTNPSIMGGSDGSINLTVTGGTAPYTFLWSNGETTEDISGLTAGCYTVTITDANGCTATSETCLTDPPLFAISATSTNDPCTLGNNGMIDSEVVTGGIPPYTYEWTDANGNVVGNTAMIPDVPAGTYTIEITDSMNQSATQTVNVITEPGPALAADDDMTTCDDEISINATADASATINWFNDPNLPAIATGNTLTDYSLSPGENMVYVVAELNGCISMDSVIVTQEAIDVSVQAAMVFCVGTDGQLMAVNNDPLDMVDYQWTPASAFTAGATTATPTLNTSLVGITEVYLATENQHGCIQIDTISVAVQDTTENFIETSNCNPLEVNFANNGSDLYMWDFGDNSPMGSGSAPVHNYATAGTYTVMMVLPVGTPNAGCLPDTITKVIEVADDPIFNTAFTIDYEACSEDSVMVVFTDNSTNATLDITGYSWQLPGGTTSVSQQDSLLIGQSGTYTASIVVTAEDGCVDSLTQTFDVSILDINLADSLVICLDEETALNPFGNPDYTYDWSNGIGTVLNPTVTGDQTTDYTVTITDPNSAVLCEVEKAVNVFVPEPMDDFTTSPETIVCVNDSTITLSASSAFAESYVWSAPLGNQVGNEASYEVPSNGAPQYYYVEATDAFGCTTLDSVLAGSAQIITALIGNDDLCLGDQATITTMTSSVGDSLFYEWTDADGNIISLDDSLNVSPTELSSYNLNISNEYGCEIDNLFDVNVVDMTNMVTADAAPDTIILGETTTLGVSGDEFTYLWNNEGTFPDGPSSAEMRNPVAMPTETTQYQVMVTNTANGCATIATVLVTVIDECDEPYIFFPNAFSPNGDGENDVLYLRSLLVDEAYFMIYNRWGEKVFESNSINNGWDGTHNGEKVCSDVYGYYLRAKCVNGKEYIRKGNVTVLK